MKKTTMQEIADALGISRVSVWKVFNGHPGVSAALRQKVLLKSEELGYPIQNISAPAGTLSESSVEAASAVPRQRLSASYKASITFSVVVSRPESSVFWLNIIHVIAKELNKSGINLMYTYVPSAPSDSFSLPPSLSNGSVQGIIVLNVYNEEILEALNTLSLPKVFLDMVPFIPTHRLNGDLLLLAGESQIHEITAHLVEKGLKRIGFIGDIDYALTNLQRFNGYTAALQNAGIELDRDICLTHSIGIETYAEEINSFLGGLPQMPEAFVCVSDYVANFAIQYFNEHGIKVPEDILISGFDGLSDYIGTTDSLTTVPIAFEPLGKRLVRQLQYRVANPDFPYEVIYTQSQVVYKDSTRDRG